MDPHCRTMARQRPSHLYYDPEVACQLCSGYERLSLLIPLSGKDNVHNYVKALETKFDAFNTRVLTRPPDTGVHIVLMGQLTVSSRHLFCTEVVCVDFNNSPMRQVTQVLNIVNSVGRKEIRGNHIGKIYFKGTATPSMPAFAQRRWVCLSDLRNLAQQALRCGCTASACFSGTDTAAHLS